MFRRIMTWCGACFVILLGWTSFGLAAPADDELFRDRVLPLFVEKCFRCHGPDQGQRKAGLQLDDRKSATAKLSSGMKAVVPHDPAGSALLTRVRADDSQRMPPVGAGARLTDVEVATLEEWIQRGAAYSRHWSFEPPRRPEWQEHVLRDPWVRGGIDAAVLSRLRAEELSPSDSEQAAVLLRRVSLDLTGLPPTVEDVDRFLSDPAPDALEREIDRLLNSMAYGEHWAARWLDLARYADSQGYAQDSGRTIWKYRDWVVRAINENMPFNQFTLEQLAGDLLDDSTEQQLIATAFHRNTMTNSEGGTDDEEFRVAAVVDRVNTTMQVWMGITMGCAQCHSHKYDPITQADYYRFFAVFNNTEDADSNDESPTLATMTADEKLQRRQLKFALEVVETSIPGLRETDLRAVEQRSGQNQTRFVRIELPGKEKTLSLGEVQVYVDDQNSALGGTASQSSDGQESSAQRAIDGDTGEDGGGSSSASHTLKEENPWWEVDLGKSFQIDRITIYPSTDRKSAEPLRDFRVAALDDQRRPVWVQLVSVEPLPAVGLVVPATVEALDVSQRAVLLDYARRFAPQALAAEHRLADLRTQWESFRGATTPIMSELEADARRTTHVHLRGNFRNQGAEVTAGVPAVFHPLSGDVGANRLAVARWLVDQRNPLTARVIANRFWEHLFGTGIVETSEDFGIQGTPPTHPALLDYLATELMRQGWDTKRFLRRLVTSSTYRQSSALRPELEQVDPVNRLLARGPRFRATGEMIRDQALLAGGLLSRKMYGPTVRPPQPKRNLKAAFGSSLDWETSEGEDRFRRGLYTTWRRTAPYPSLTTFGAPSREFCTVRRIRTNTPLQALATLNDPVFIEAAQGLARRIVAESGPTTRERVARGFQICLSRTPADSESQRLILLYETALNEYHRDEVAARAMATDPLGDAPAGVDLSELAAWTVVANALLNLDETLARR